MEREQYRKIIMHVGAASIIFGLGWSFGIIFGEIYTELWKVALILLGITLITISLIPKKKNKK